MRTCMASSESEVSQLLELLSISCKCSCKPGELSENLHGFIRVGGFVIARVVVNSLGVVTSSYGLHSLFCVTVVDVFVS